MLKANASFGDDLAWHRQRPGPPLTAEVDEVGRMRRELDAERKTRAAAEVSLRAWIGYAKSQESAVREMEVKTEQRRESRAREVDEGG